MQLVHHLTFNLVFCNIIENFSPCFWFYIMYIDSYWSFISPYQLGLDFKNNSTDFQSSLIFDLYHMEKGEEFPWCRWWKKPKKKLSKSRWPSWLISKTCKLENSKHFWKKNRTSWNQWAVKITVICTNVNLYRLNLRIILQIVPPICVTQECQLHLLLWIKQFFLFMTQLSD